jgi:hypothetical protein
MTDAELVQAVAEQVMGWRMSVDGGWWHMGDGAVLPSGGLYGWNPLTNDAHMDMVLAKADFWHMKVWVIKMGKNPHVSADVDGRAKASDSGYTMASIKRAMLQAIVEAVG